MLPGAPIVRKHTRKPTSTGRHNQANPLLVKESVRSLYAAFLTHGLPLGWPVTGTCTSAACRCCAIGAPSLFFVSGASFSTSSVTFETKGHGLHEVRRRRETVQLPGRDLVLRETLPANALVCQPFPPSLLSYVAHVGRMSHCHSANVQYPSCTLPSTTRCVAVSLPH